MGGLNREFRLAGDWDLWRRMAREMPVTTLRAVLACHRRHPGQLSTNLEEYWREIDTAQTADDLLSRLRDEEDIGYVGKWREDLDRWDVNSVLLGNMQDARDHRKSFDQSSALRIDFSKPTLPGWVCHISGSSTAESWGRWSDAALAPSVRISSFSPLPAKATLRIRLAVLHVRCNPVVLTVGARAFEIRADTAPRDFSFEIAPQAPANMIDICPAISMSPVDLRLNNDSRRLGVALHFLEVIPASSPA